MAMMHDSLSLSGILHPSNLTLLCLEKFGELKAEAEGAGPKGLTLFQ